MPRPLSLPIVIHIFHIIPLLSLDSYMILREDIIIWENGSVRNVQIPRQQTALPCTTCAETAMTSLIRAFSDFTLDIPYNPAQIAGFEEDMEKYCQ